MNDYWLPSRVTVAEQTRDDIILRSSDYVRIMHERSVAIQKFQRIRDRIDEAWYAYQNNGPAGTLEGSDVIYASVLEDLAEIVHSPAPVCPKCDAVNGRMSGAVCSACGDITI